MHINTSFMSQIMFFNLDIKHPHEIYNHWYELYNLWIWMILPHITRLCGGLINTVLPTVICPPPPRQFTLSIVRLYQCKKSYFPGVILQGITILTFLLQGVYTPHIWHSYHEEVRTSITTWWFICRKKMCLM